MSLSGSVLTAFRKRREHVGTLRDGTKVLRDAGVVRACKGTKLSESRIRALCEKAEIPYEKGMRARTIDFIGSDETCDRAGDIIKVAGWELGNYQKNPVFLWAHDYGTPPIGRALEVKIESSKGQDGSERSVLRFSILFAKSDFAGEILSLYKQGMMTATSVGFIPKSARAMTEEEHESARASIGEVFEAGFVFEKQELLELSAVPVPCNPEALELAFDAGRLAAKSVRRLALGGFDVSDSLRRKATQKQATIVLDDEMSYRVRAPAFFIENTLSRVPWLSEPAQIDIVQGKLIESPELAVQSVRFPFAAGWTEESVTAWVAEHESELVDLSPITEGEPTEEPPTEPEEEEEGDDEEEEPMEMAEDDEAELDKQTEGMLLHELIFDSELFDEESASAWAEANGYGAIAEADTSTEGELRYEVTPIDELDEESILEEELDTGVLGKFGLPLDSAEDEPPDEEEPVTASADVTVEDGVQVVRLQVDMSPTISRAIESIQMELDSVRAEMRELRSMFERRSTEPRVQATSDDDDETSKSYLDEVLDMSKLDDIESSLTSALSGGK